VHTNDSFLDVGKVSECFPLDFDERGTIGGGMVDRGVVGDVFIWKTVERELKAIVY
jgi:hypothetical protein